MTLFAYLRVSTDNQDVANQKMGVSQYCAKHWPELQAVYIEDTVSGKTPWNQRAIGKALMSARTGDIFVASEISRLARQTLQVLQIMEHCATHKIEMHIVKNGIKIDDSLQSKVTATVLGLAAEIERDLISSRTKEALARKKAEGMKLGRPPGLAKVRKLDKHANEIDKLISAKVSKRAVARVIGVSPNTLHNWIRDRVQRKN
jgi:DNA invertase Pin-like site-specific DNA recombinase